MDSSAGLAPELRTRLRGACSCPRCGSDDLLWGASAVACRACQSDYSIVADIPVLLPDAPSPSYDSAWDPGLIRRLPARLRPAALRTKTLVRPQLTHKSRRSRHQIAAFARSFDPTALLLNLGAGAKDYGPSVVNLDIAPEPGIHVVGLAERLPFRDESFDGVIFQAVLEHVQDAERALSEIRRVLVPRGALMIEIPFMQGYHPSPGDYRRYTEQGLRTELERRGFVVEASGVAVGPASAAAWVGSEFLALLLSGRSATAYRIARIFTDLLVWPLKFADAWLEAHPMAHVIASGVYARARKPESGTTESEGTNR